MKKRETSLDIHANSFQILFDFFGTHSAVSDQLGLTIRSYRRIRERGKASSIVAKAIELLVEKIMEEKKRKEREQAGKDKAALDTAA